MFFAGSFSAAWASLQALPAGLEEDPSTLARSRVAFSPDSALAALPSTSEGSFRETGAREAGGTSRAGARPPTARLSFP